MLKEFGHFRLLRPLAGSRCEVYVAEDTTTGQQVVLKILPESTAPAALPDRSRAELTLATQLREPHLVPVEDWGEIGGRLYLQMPLLIGTDLQTLLERDGPLEATATAEVVHQIGSALDAAHRAGLIHSRVTPQHIFVAEDGTASLLGLGCQDFPSDLDERSERADVYGLACVAGACLAGGPSLPTAVEDVFERGMSEDPADRFASPVHLANALRDALTSDSSDDSDDSDDMPVPFGHYLLRRRLPRPGIAQYEAEDTATAERVALTILAADSSDSLVRRVRRDATMTTLVLRPLGEPLLVLVDHVGDVDGQCYLQMPFIVGLTLETLLERYGPLTPSRAVQIVSQIAGALDAVHHAAPVPGAVTPDKILVGDDNLAYLLCEPLFGDDDADRATPHAGQTATAYFAPERLDTGDRSNAGDRYSLACILYACLTGTPPFAGDAEQQRQAHLVSDPPEPSAANQWVPRAFDEVIARGMAKDPQQRYPSAGELAAAARGALASVAARTVEEASPVRTVEISTVSSPLQLPDCHVCGEPAGVDAGPTPTGEMLCGSCRQRGLPGELLRRLKRDPGNPVTIAGYALLETLERRGPGPVFRVRSQHTGELCVLRVAPKTSIAPDESRRPPPLADLSGLRSTHLVAVKEVIAVGDFYLVVSEYCPGDSVEGLIRRLGRLSVHQAMALILPCLDGLDAAHSFTRSDGSIGVMHRNITPASLLLTWAGSTPVTKIADFGFASPEPPDPTFTPRPQLLKPERAARDVDTWRIGACLYFMLSGEAPRRAAAGRSPADVVMGTQPAPIRRLNPDVPPRLAAVIDDAVTDAPHISIPTASHLAAALRDAVPTRFS